MIWDNDLQAVIDEIPLYEIAKPQVKTLASDLLRQSLTDR
jgi:hypothetical protein